MKNLFKILASIFLLVLIVSCQDGKGEYSEKEVAENKEMTKEELVERGEYLVTVIGCDHCHTPKKMTEKGPVPDMERRFMGFPASDSIAAINKEELGPGKWILMNNDLTAAVGPWGVSFAANITSDDTGLGSWSYEQFKKSMTEGLYKGLENSRPIMPPMPWESMKELTEEDLKSIYEYLQSTPPIENVVPAYIPPPAM